jgi:hypothetical protein
MAPYGESPKKGDTVKLSELLGSIVILLLFVSASVTIAATYPSLLSWTGAAVFVFVSTGVAASEIRLYRQKLAEKHRIHELRAKLLEE